MEKTLHKVAGIYATRDEALAARTSLIERGFSAEQITLVSPEDAHTDEKIEPEGDGVAKHVIKDALIGGVIGGGVGGATAAAMAAASITLFVASPILAPLTIMGWGAAVGAFAGAGKGISMEQDQFAAMVKDVANDGKYVVIVQAHSDEESSRARDLIGQSAADESDVRSV